MDRFFQPDGSFAGGFGGGFKFCEDFLEFASLPVVVLPITAEEGLRVLDRYVGAKDSPEDPIVMIDFVEEEPKFILGIGFPSHRNVQNSPQSQRTPPEGMFNLIRARVGAHGIELGSRQRDGFLCG